jgi:hypothetical protein
MPYFPLPRPSLEVSDVMETRSQPMDTYEIESEFIDKCRSDDRLGSRMVLEVMIKVKC